MKTLTLLLVAFSSAAFAQNAETFGTSSETVIAIPYAEFASPRTNATATEYVDGLFIQSANIFDFVAAGVHFPSGALITRLELQACDSNSAASGNLILSRIPTDLGSGIPIAQVNTGVPAIPGCSLFPVTLPSPPTVDNANFAYQLTWKNEGATDGTVRLQAVRVFYKLQVKPAPVTETFTDVPTSHPFFQFIEALAASGITAGCNASPPQFCPDATLTRGQMAVFLSRALGLHWAP
jgi:S-layer family protein